MGIKQISFVADKEFSIKIKRKKLRRSFKDSVKFRDQTSLKGTISKLTPGVSIALVDRIDLRATDSENPESTSLVWKYLGNDSPLRNTGDKSEKVSKVENAEINYNEEYHKSADISGDHDPKKEAAIAKEIFLGAREEVLTKAKEKRDGIK